MNIEEKAKAYDEAINVAKTLLNTRCVEGTNGYFHRKDIEEMFPGLVENEDERIRKELLAVIDDLILPDEQKERFVAWLENHKIECFELKAGNSYFCYKSRWERADNETFKKGLIYKCNKDGVLDNFVIKNPEQHFFEIKDERITLLEKQGEQKSVECIKDKALSKILNKVICRFINNPDIPYSERNEVSVKLIPYVEMLEKQGEQNLIKIPKFNSGDTIEFSGFGHNKYTIKEVCGTNHYINSDGKRMDMAYTDANFELVEHKPVEWNINLAKKGDILSNGTIVLIFDSLGKFDEIPVINSWYFADSEKFYGKGMEIYDQWVIDGFRPASEIEKNYLFKIMNEAGYSWNTKSNVLEEKPVVWSEEDEKIKNALIKYLSESDALCIDLSLARCWLECLKDRVLSQPNQEWKLSEEEKAALRTAIHIMTEERSFPKLGTHLQNILNVFE